MHYYESRFRQQEILRLHKTAQRLGLQLVEAAPSQT
jgi:hypothetical protein